MKRSLQRSRTALLALLGVAWAGWASAQSPPAATEVPPWTNRATPTSIAVGPYGVSSSSLASPPAFEPDSGERLDAPACWFAAVDLGAVVPHANSRVTSGMPLGPQFAAPVRLPTAPLSWTASPRFETGYRWSDGEAVRLGYRFLATSGSASGPAGELHSQLDLHVVDVDDVSNETLAENRLRPFRELRLAWGVRLATVSLATRGSGPGGIDSRFSSRFAGAGPHFGLEWSKPLPGSPFEMYARADAAGLLGQTRQSFAATATDADGGLVAAARRDPARSNGAIALNALIGVGWRPDPARPTRLVLGYQLDPWWNLGHANASDFQLTVQGVFLRAEWRY